MTNPGPEELAHLSAASRRLLGKDLGDCTREDLHRLAELLTRESARLGSVRDQLGAAINETTGCGCGSEVPINDDGSLDHARIRPRHVCDPK